MLIHERIRIQREVKHALRRAKLSPQAPMTAVNAALERVKHAHARLRSFREKHPLFSKIIWILDLFTALIPLKSRRQKLLKLQSRIVVVAAPVVAPKAAIQLPKPPSPPAAPLVHLVQKPITENPRPKTPPHTPEPPLKSYADHLAQFQTELYSDDVKDATRKIHLAFGVELCHFTVQCEEFFRGFKSSLQNFIEKHPEFEESDTAKVSSEAADRFGGIYQALLHSLNTDGLKYDVQHELFVQLIGHWKSVKECLEAYPKESDFTNLLALLRRVDHAIDPQVIAARLFIERKIRQLETSQKKEEVHLKKIPKRDPEEKTFMQHDRTLSEVIDKRLESYKKQIECYHYLAMNLVKAPEIATWDLCSPDRSEITIQTNYSKYFKRAIGADADQLKYFEFWSSGVKDEIDSELNRKLQRFKKAQSLIDKQ